jgi:hypothetical protein
MRRFEFRLQVALDHAQRLEDSASLKLAELQTERERQERRLEGLLNLCARMTEELAAAQTGELEMGEVRSRRLHLDDAWTQVAEQRLGIVDLDAAIVVQRETAVELMQKRQVLERVKDTHSAQHVADGRALERLALDESATTRYARGAVGAE